MFVDAWFKEQMKCYTLLVPIDRNRGTEIRVAGTWTIEG